MTNRYQTVPNTQIPSFFAYHRPEIAKIIMDRIKIEISLSSRSSKLKLND